MRVQKSPLRYGIQTILMVGLLGSLVSCATSPGGNDSGDFDAIEAAQTITKNREQAARIVREVMDSVDTEDFDSIQASIKKYEEAADLLDEAVKLSTDSLQPRLERFEIRKRVADGYQYIYAILDQECTPLEDEGLKPEEGLLRRRIEAKSLANRWLRLAQRDMEVHLRNTAVAYQHPKQYWDLQQIYVALGDYGSARTTLLQMMEQYGTKLSSRDRKAAESRIRLYAQKMIDAEG
ncbi:MAG: hypothetical protein VX764_00215 [Planctomycetota bacterium]|nr:hypothetical protein [Planctomycetota bacterium]